MAERIRRVRNALRQPTKAIPAKALQMLEVARRQASTFENRMFAEMVIYATEQAVYNDNRKFLDFIKQLREPPVSIETFLDSSDFMASTDLVLWPEVRKAIIEINKYWWKGKAGNAHDEVLLAGATGCVDKDTEYLTPTGWKYMDEYTEGDLVAQYAGNGEIEFVEPEAYVKIEYPFFFDVVTRSFDQRLTPGHRVIYRQAKTGVLMETAAEDMVESHNNTKRGFTGKFIGDYFYDGPGLPFTDEQIRVMVAVMADGSFYKRPGHHRNYCVIAVKKVEKKLRIGELLRAAHIPYNRYDRENGFADIAFLAPERNKTYEGWWGASQAQLQVIANEVLNWDGTQGRDEFYTRNKPSADFIQHVFAATGERATINPCYREDGSVDYVVHVVKNNSWTIISSSRKDIELVDSEDGFCYCFTVPTGMWLSRRSGKVVVTGNTGKTECVKISTAYHLYILGCMCNPQSFWGLPEATAIVFSIQAAKPHVTKKVLYMPLRTYIETMPWFVRNMRPNKILEGEMYFENLNIRVVQGGADSDTVLGDAIIHSDIDEINFFNVVENSRKAAPGTGRSGTYDQGQVVFTTVTRRKKSRFTTQGPTVGMIMAASSTRYKGDFTDRRIQFVKDHDIKTTYVYNKAQFEVVPQDRYSGKKFRLLVANEAALDIRILDDGELVSDNHNVIEIPIEYLDDFKSDAPGALRDIVGRSVSSINPFFRQQSKIMYCVKKGEEAGLKSFLHKDNVVLGFESLPLPVSGHYCRNPSKPRYVHVDLSISQDRAAVCMLRFDGLEKVDRRDGSSEYLPIAAMEVALTIEPDHGHEIDIAEVRTWVKMLRVVYGYPIKAVTYDGFASVESRQAWAKQGMKTGVVSVDKTSVPYKQLRDALYDGRILLFHQPVLLDELFGLEYDEKKDKIDHTISGGKDCADALAGAYYTLLNRSSSWQDTQSDEGGMAGRQDYGDRYDDYERPV